MTQPSADSESNPLREIVQPFIDLVRAPRALWGVNLGYVIEGFVYFGMLGYLAMHFSDFVFRGVENADVHSHHMVLVLTAGITIAMFFLGFIADRFGVRRALIWAFLLMLAGRVLISGAPSIGLEPAGLWSPLHVVTVLGILLVVTGYGMYQPGAYAAVRQFTNPKTAAMGFAMLYALMNLGGYLPTFAFLLRDDDFLGLGIVGTYWFYTVLTVVALLATVVILSPRTVKDAIERAKTETAALKQDVGSGEGRSESTPSSESTTQPPSDRVPRHWWLVWVAGLAAGWYFTDGNVRWSVVTLLIAAVAVVAVVAPVRRWVAAHPFSDVKFFFFIFSLIPVQTLFVYNWLILPQYINRAYEGWIGEYFEIAANFNPILIFILVPIVTAISQRANVYNMMIAGTFVMAAPAFLLAVGTEWYLLLGYILIMTVGEAMWQPRFLQYAAEIAPEGRTGIYMGVAQFPWFLTKVIVPLYSGHMIARYVPTDGVKNPETMWLFFAIIAMTSTLLLVLAKGWLGRDFKTKSDD
jgi:MFS family permease